MKWVDKKVFRSSCTEGEKSCHLKDKNGFIHPYNNSGREPTMTTVLITLCYYGDIHSCRGGSNRGGKKNAAQNKIRADFHGFGSLLKPSSSQWGDVSRCIHNLKSTALSGTSHSQHQMAAAHAKHLSHSVLLFLFPARTSLMITELKEIYS